MKKKYVISISIILIITLTISIGIFYNHKFSKKEEIINNEMISIMLETENGKYESSSERSWPTSGYVLNTVKSYCENGSTLAWNKETKKVRVNIKGTDKCYVYFDKENYTNYCLNGYDENLACELIKKDDKTLIYHDGSIKDEEGNVTDAFDYSYRYAGSSEEVKNFVCLDGGATSEGNCASDNDLYRIIGLFKNTDEESEDYGKYEMKLIKYDYATIDQLGDTGGYIDIYNTDRNGTYRGNQENLVNTGRYKYSKYSRSDYDAGTIINYWSESLLNTQNLNIDFYNYLQDKNVSNMIEKHTWKTIGSKLSNAKTLYDYEMGVLKDSNPSYPTNKEEEQANIGLIYGSDYAYAASSESTNNYSLNVVNYNTNDIPNNNWMYMGLYEYTLTRITNRYQAFYIQYDGLIGDGDSTIQRAIRPSFYLKSSVKLQSGNGTKENPYRLSV